MNRLTGIRSNWLMDAARYREWRTNRSIYIGIWLALVIPWVLMNKGYYPEVPSGWTYPSMILAAILGIAVVWNDRVREHLSYALEGPLSRRQVLVTKIQYVILMVATANLVILVITLLGSGLAGHLLPIEVALPTALLLTLYEMCVAITALVVGVAIGSLILIVGTVGLINLFPLVLASFINFLALSQPPINPLTAVPMPPPAWALTLANVVSHFSAFVPLYPSGWSRLAFGLIALVWTGFVIRVALYWWDRIPLERFGTAVFYPWLWNLYYAVFALISDVIVVVTTNVQNQFSRTLLLFTIGVLAVIGWFFWRWALRKLQIAEPSVKPRTEP